jgi:hypothetical protein
MPNRHALGRWGKPSKAPSGRQHLATRQQKKGVHSKAEFVRDLSKKSELHTQKRFDEFI